MTQPRALTCIEVQTGDGPTAAVIWMHGLGADGRDFLPIVQELDLQDVGPVRLVFPNAPVMPVTINGGYPMPAWYDILGADLVRREDEAGLRQSCVDITALVRREMDRGMPASRIVLAGFSQGCAMALMTGLRFGHALAGIMGLSGYVPLAEHTPAERSAASVQTPIFLAHGQRNGVIDITRAQASRALLQSLGHAVQWHDYPMEHSVCPAEVADIEAWLKQVLRAA